MKHAASRILLVATVGLAGCVSEINPPSFPALDDPGLGEAPDAPTAVLGDRRVSLQWPAVEGEVDSYRIYRDEGEGSEELLVGEVADTSWMDEDVQNLTLYRYRVAGVHTDGVEGLRSEWASVVPGIFSVTINGGQASTTDTDVWLDFGAPSTAIWLRLGESQDLSGQNWLPYTAGMDWQLVGPDGPHRINVEFRDVYDNLSERVQAEILLDRVAVIEDFRYDKVSQGQLFVEFELTAGELGGQAWAELESLTVVPLIDPESDGIFIGSWTAGEIGDTILTRVIGHFRDDAGNEASPFFVPEMLRILPWE